MKVATSPGHRTDFNRTKKHAEPHDEPAPTLADSVASAQEETAQVPWDPSAVRNAADRLRALVEKRGL